MFKADALMSAKRGAYILMEEGFYFAKQGRTQLLFVHQRAVMRLCPHPESNIPAPTRSVSSIFIELGFSRHVRGKDRAAAQQISLHP